MKPDANGWTWAKPKLIGVVKIYERTGTHPRVATPTTEFSQVWPHKLWARYHGRPVPPKKAKP